MLQVVALNKELLSAMGRKLFLADDSVTIQKVVALTFSSEDMEIITASDGQEALERLQEVTPDVILLDIFMPHHDGYEVCAFIKQSARLSQVPVILLVGAFEPFDHEKAKAVGADDYLTKPFQSIKQLVNKVNNLLEPPAAIPITADEAALASGTETGWEQDAVPPPEREASHEEHAAPPAYAMPHTVLHPPQYNAGDTAPAESPYTKAPAAWADAEALPYEENSAEIISTDSHSTGPLYFSATGAETMRPRAGREETGDYGFDDTGIEVTSIIYPPQDDLPERREASHRHADTGDTPPAAHDDILLDDFVAQPNAAPTLIPEDNILFEDATPQPDETPTSPVQENDILFDDSVSPLDVMPTSPVQENDILFDDSVSPSDDKPASPIQEDDVLFDDSVSSPDAMPVALLQEDDVLFDTPGVPTSAAPPDTPLFMDDLLDLPAPAPAALPSLMDWPLSETAPVAPLELRSEPPARPARNQDELLELDDLSYNPRYHVDADGEDDVLDIYEEPPVLLAPEPAPTPETTVEEEAPAEYPLDILEPLPEPVPAADAAISATESDDQTAVSARAISEPPAEAATPQQPRLITLADLAPDALEAIARRVVEMMSDRAVQEIAWEIVPDLAELHIKRRLDEQAL